MPSFAVGTVHSVLLARPGLQRIFVALDDTASVDAEPERAYVLTKLTGEVGIGDRVVVNTTAVELGLGTGGWDPVHSQPERGSRGETRSRPALKDRSTQPP